MAIRLEAVLVLLQEKLASLNLNPSYLDNARPIERQVVADLYKTIVKMDKQDYLEVDESDELYDASQTSDDFEAVLEDEEDRGVEGFEPEYIDRVLDFQDAYPHYSFKTLNHQFPRVKYPIYLSRFREYRAQKGTKREKFREISKFCKDTFDTARASGCIVHDRTVKMWAMCKAREVQLIGFKASHSWIARWKTAYRIRSRKIVRFITFRNMRRREEIENAALELIVEHMDQIHGRFDPSEVFNSDQSGFTYIVHTNRTLSYVGERDTIANVQASGPLTHSYTIQPLLNMDGVLVGKLFVNLKESEGVFGPQVAATLPRYSNLYITCSSSGKLTKTLAREWVQKVFAEALNRLHDNKAVIYIDSWTGHKDEALYNIAGKNVTVKVFPEGSTSLVQPLDLYCFRQWKDFAKRLTEHCLLYNFRIDQRADILRMQSLIYNQFQHPAFRPMWLCGWRLAGFEVPHVEFKSLSEMLFTFDGDCVTSECILMPFIRCVYCTNVFCAECFYMKYHFCNAPQ